MIASVATVLSIATSAISAGSIPVRRATAVVRRICLKCWSVGLQSMLEFPNATLKRINANRVAQFPDGVDCNNICIKVLSSGRDVFLLLIDSLGWLRLVAF
ncbi:hypothetical protein B0T10DRAFT_454719 [Thelonectria olida]|uniref:Secreted protein n=1 Tax=Thelonectria olida TaxID=1576542 RepID=A0A9P9AX12_9HYPO|nr:hypothetical protein B0T10DRAFT_454719 [Thelonectria olida]